MTVVTGPQAGQFAATHGKPMTIGRAPDADLVVGDAGVSPHHVRIARGAGVQVQDVNRLMKQFLDMQRMMKQLKGSGLRRLMGAFRGGSP